MLRLVSQVAVAQPVLRPRLVPAPWVRSQASVSAPWTPSPVLEGRRVSVTKDSLLPSLNLLSRTILNINMNTLQRIACSSFPGRKTRLLLSCLSDFFFQLMHFPAVSLPKIVQAKIFPKLTRSITCFFPDDPYLQARSIGQCGLRRLNWSKQHVEIYLANYHANHRRT